MYDIAIIGLGPAGATLARLLSKEYKVIAIDKKTENNGKCCGGLLSPDAQKILAKFDLCLPLDILVDPQIFSVRTIDVNNKLEKFYQRFYLNMDRAKFDNWLISLISDNVKIYSNSFCKKIIKNKNDYDIEFECEGQRYTEKAKMVIGADGANSIIRNIFYKKHKIKKYVAIQEWYEEENTSPFYSCVFNKNITDSYCWTISKNNNFIIGGAFPIENSNERFEELKSNAKEAGFNFKNLVKREGCFVYIPKGLKSVCTGKNDAYLIGEAAGMISPSSLEGISYALESAYILAKLLNNKKNKNIGLKYYFKTLKIRFKLKIKLIKMPFMYNKFIRKLVLKSGLNSINKI